MQHLVVDAFVDDASWISEIEPIFEFLMNLPDEIGMNRITQPYVFRYHGVVPEDWGITGMVIIAEPRRRSHLPRHKRFHMDVFSCKPFNPAARYGWWSGASASQKRAADVIRRPVLGDEVRRPPASATGASSSARRYAALGAAPARANSAAPRERGLGR